MSTQFSALVSKLKEIFQINRPDLDFWGLSHFKCT